MFCISYRRQHSEQGVTNPVYVGNVASNKLQFLTPIYEEIRGVYGHSGQPDVSKSTPYQNTADDDYDDVDRLSIKSDDIAVNEDSCKNSEPLPPPRQKKVSTTDGEATMQPAAASVGNEYTYLKNCASSEPLPPFKQQEAVATTTHEPKAPTQPVAGDTSNDYAVLITPPTASSGVYQELVAAAPVPPGYDVPSNVPATSPVTDSLDDNSKPCTSS